ncbi:hypothetical protein F4553_006610 [Allocatelliglobosispora scoriae]|uniref:Uncharacterized protein n=1 Tax=Allocatelliglobosispora scoriae TaxID=643052 RepID=A0A841C004_9ACTN|nr:hypothetical protein [Allocatelliglobosispora scoriae]MBB5873176.1 hypothetical protein [Allocatelliglobosispora scoriae]
MSSEWCRACGNANAGDPCSRCATPLTRPDPGSPRIGRVVNIGGRLLTKYAIAIGDAGGTVSVLVKPDTITPIPVAQFDAYTAAPVPGPAVIGAAGRLWIASSARKADTVKGKWPVEPVEAAAATFAVASLGARRAAALDSLMLGSAGWLDHLQLTASEAAWYRAWSASSKDDLATMLTFLEKLPPTGYAARIPLLQRHAAKLLASPAHTASARRVAEPLVDLDPDAQAMHAAFAPAPVATVIDLANSYAQRLTDLGSPLPTGSLVALPAAIRNGERLPIPSPTQTAALRTLDAYVAGMAGSSLDGTPDAIATLPIPLLDELIARKALTRIAQGPAPWLAPVTAYLRSRLHPGTADLAELQEVGFVAELARRYFYTSDDERLAALPADDPAVAHYRALREYRLSGTLGDGLRAPARHVLAMVEVIRQGGSEASRQAPAEVAADASCWPLIRELAYRGEVTISDEVRRGHPEFGAWLDLCTMQRRVFEARWSDVITTGRQLAATSNLETLQDEALNMVAFAQWQLGRPSEALRVLNEALTGRFTAGLVVNAALVAGEQSCRPAFPYLAQAMRLSTDPRVRQGAVSRAITVWLEDSEAQDYPDALAEIVREALATPQADDDFHNSILTISAIHDRQWLAGAAPAAANAGQAAAIRYFILRSRATSDSHQETFIDVATMLVGLCRMNPRPSWVDRERTWLTEMLMDAVHVPFGEAAGLVGVIEAFTAGGVLPLEDELILLMQAGTHVAVRISDDEGELATEAEQRLVFAPLRKFRERRGELPDGLREAVALELGRCAVVAAIAFVVTTERAWDLFGETWEQLIQRERWDVQNRYAIVMQEKRILDVFDTYVARCRGYLNAMAGLPLSEASTEQRDLIVSSVDRWAAESARLRSLL